MDLIRKECTLREIKVHTRTNKSDRIKCLRHYDRLINSGERTAAASTKATGSTRRTKHGMYHLINVLMTKDMINRLIDIAGKKFDQQDLDDVEASQKLNFGKTSKQSMLVTMKSAKASSLMTKLLRVSTHRSSYHTTQQNWRNCDLSIYEANFRMSGMHSRHFKKLSVVNMTCFIFGTG
ncbi:hypothetical protein PHPALM_14065 [Phytophthora palmivora]|uniref:Uncharacterized protein n=1 Tax=Phytophthora palmivora TaxID=4796 RepID=A0A2P4XVQ4_9STRA|nr:hypothetical protein PHPALM_14065 [Phytophthora palmivora]